MSELQRPPWWFSDEGSDPSTDGSRETNWLSMLGSLGTMFGELASEIAGDWWAASGAASHSEHADPKDHPDCVICKAMTTVTVTLAEPEVRELPAVRWLPLRRL